MPEALTSALTSQDLLRGHSILLDKFMGLIQIFYLEIWVMGCPRSDKFFFFFNLILYKKEGQELAYQLSDEPAEWLMECMDTGLSFFLTSPCSWGCHIEIRIVDMVSWHTQNHGYNKLHCTFFPTQSLSQSH
ncbi:hypothetical protein TNIN_326041 [Trichonephila inaurata madagascariensis]|uniref:Uncharacterized protein n=1 Tax=Trichonephila inaurata madagascariensis TaxID=2747483 RepID=A0A8X6K835_9ARAC|nr:hypothetical protein TNIN_326041 [Trichonephila inaurata madagascariensis]